VAQKARFVTFIIAVFALFFAIGNGVVAIWNHGDLLKGGLLPRRSTRVFLMTGVDARGGETASRSDTIILLFLHPKNEAVSLLFVPRDTRVWIDGESYQRKINFAHSKGGIQLLKETLEEQIKVDIEGYVEVDFEGFKEVIDLLGGVEIDVEKRMYNPPEDIDIQPGKQRLNGYDALGYVRYRSDGLGDIGRIERQRKFLQELFKQSFKLTTLIKSPQIISQLIQYTITDLTVSQILEIAGQLAGQPEIDTHTLPGESAMINGGSYWVTDDEQARVLVKQLMAGENAEVQ
jgi:LCP family protein required for cell wall assembly